MLKILLPPKVKFICGFIYREEKYYKLTLKMMKKLWGEIDLESETINFNFTAYYTEEMGSPLFRRFISFKNLRNSEEFVNIKLICIKLEKKFSIGGKRRINIDPGYLTLANLVLLTTKNFYHRIHLNKGIYGEVTLRYISKVGFSDFNWTYPDFKTSQYKDIFLKIRNIYSNQLKISLK
ncbi:MAG: DUF4416 family protein [Candidatus Omnitrophica bacterium]|nr:DUF4416 family protein [Candidatus Omnitrophota bacterium]MCM8826127.1 DUF4416 family protein [Candidatus Omnitrophota bacterium]